MVNNKIMKHKEIRNPYANEVTWSSYHGITIDATPQELIDFCENNDIEYFFNNTGDDKTNLDIEFYVPSSELYFTVYDWKEYEPLDMDREYEFHIGAKGRVDSIVGKEILTNLL